MNIPDGFFENPVSPEYADLLSTMGDQSLFFNCGYVVPPLNAQYEEVQPDLHSLERYDFSKMPDLPWYP